MTNLFKMIVILAPLLIPCSCSIVDGGSSGPSENTAVLCQDQQDNDADGLIDCEDPECWIFDFCPGGDSDTDAGTGTDTGTDTDTDTDVNEPSEKWVFVYPVSDSIQETSSFPLALGSDGTVYSVANPFGSGAKLYAIGADGGHKWVNTDLPIRWDDYCGLPVLSEGTNTVYVVCQELGDPVDTLQVYAISTSGSLKWKEEIPEVTWYPGQIALYYDGLTPVDHLLLITNNLPGGGRIDSIDSNGAVGPPFDIEDSPLVGLAIDASNVSDC